tara:strand:+ start:1346 stop:1981 length:636 start_codon:yes stop_codon:yes gene_type:complete
MIIQCQSCLRKFVVKDSDIPQEGKNVQCGYCSVTWYQLPVQVLTKISKQKKPIKKINEELSIDGIKASDGKTYKFLGSQWAQLLPSGKTGLFAKKKIGKELDKLTGRNIEKEAKRKEKKSKELNPSSENFNNKNIPDIYKPKEGMGFFGYIFLLIIIAFSFVGIIKTFENDLIEHYPELAYTFILVDEQLEFLAETVKNLITIAKDLINSY